MAAHENIVLNNKGERAPSSYSYEPIVRGNYSRSIMEAAPSMKMAPGALPRPGRVPEQRLMSPETCFRLAAELRNFSWMEAD